MVLNQVIFPPILWQGSLFSTFCLQYLLFVDFLMRIILTSMEWNLFVVLMCISVIVIDVEHLSKCFLAISFLNKCLFRSSTHFCVLFVFLILSGMSCLYILEMWCMSKIAHPKFCYTKFIVFSLTFRSLNHFEFIYLFIFVCR